MNANFETVIAEATAGINPLTTEINDMVILSAEDRADTAEMITQCKRIEKQLKAVKAEFIKPLKDRVKSMEIAIKPFEIQLKANIASIKKANERWDVKLLEAERARKEEFETEQKRKADEALKKVIKAKKAGQEAAKADLKALTPQAYKSEVATHETTAGNSTARLVDKWRIILPDGSEWDKKSRLNALQFFEGGAQGLAVGWGITQYLQVDAVAINEAFKKGERNHLPHFVEVYQGTREVVR